VTPRTRGIAIGVSHVAANDYTLAIRVQRRELMLSDELREIVATANGEADIRYVGRVRKRDGDPPTQQRTRPLVMGLSVAHVELSAGTLGCFVRADDERIHVLSNNHVLADENRAEIGDRIVQPGPWDGGKAGRDTVAELTRFEPLDVVGVNRLDCAVAALANDMEYDAGALMGGSDGLDPRPFVPREGILVEKIGRTTGRTIGRLSALNVSVLGVEFDTADNVRFDGQLEIEDVGGTPFSADGDSGSIVFAKDERRPIGLLFSGDDSAGPNETGVTYANPLPDVLKALRVSLVP